jgi:polysaccharide export outer membrane protein
MMNGRKLAVVAVLLLAGCGPTLPPLQPMAEGPYRLDAGDQVRVIVFGQKDLSERFSVNDSGQISLPLVGPLTVRGLTVQELEDALVDRFADGLIASPSVSVQVETFRPFYILGEVRNPGQYKYNSRMSVLTAVAIAGGFTYRARTDTASITRNVDGRKIEGRATHTADVAPGDVIVIDERFF